MSVSKKHIRVRGRHSNEKDETIFQVASKNGSKSSQKSWGYLYDRDNLETSRSLFNANFIFTQGLCTMWIEI